MVELSSTGLNTHFSVRSACQHEVPKPGLKYGQSARRSLGMTNTANTNDSLTEWFQIILEIGKPVSRKGGGFRVVIAIICKAK